MADQVTTSILNGNMNVLPLSTTGLRDIPIDPLAEYVSGGPGGIFTWPWLRLLPLPDDDLEVVLGNDVYKRMLQDPQVFASTMLVISQTMRRGIRLNAAYEDGNRDSPDYKKSVKIRDFCARALSDMTASLDEACTEMLWDAFTYGYCNAEKTFKHGTDADAGKLVYRSIKPKPRQVYSMVVDPYFNYIGCATWVGPQALWLNEMVEKVGAQSIIPSSYLGINWAFVPREKFAHLAFLPTHSDPRGRSGLRPAYNSWYEKMKLWPELDLFWQRFAGPGLIGNTADGAQPMYPLDADGQPDTTKPKVSPQAVLLQAAVGYHNGEAVILPFGANLRVEQNSNDGGSFMGGIALCDGQINMAITLQQLQNRSGGVMSRSAAETHQDSGWNAVLYLRRIVCSMVKRDILEDLVVKNYGEGARRLTPNPDLGRVAPEDLARNLEVLGRARQSGGIHWTQMLPVWPDFDMPLPDFEIWIEENIIAAQIVAQAGAPVPVPGADNTDPAAPGAPAATPAPAAAVPAGVPESTANKYAVQEMGKADARGLARRLAGGRGVGFSRNAGLEDEEETS